MSADPTKHVVDGVVRVLMRCDSSMKSHSGFAWPKSGHVECPDWEPSPECGNGMHGWAWGVDLGEGADYDIINDVFLVVEVLPDDIVSIKGKRNKCKFAKGNVVFAGKFQDAWSLIHDGRHSYLMDSSTSASSGDESTSAAIGDSSNAASSGDYSKAASSGDYSTAAASGDSSTAASSGNFSTSSASGNYSTAASSGNYSTAASSGDSSTSSASGNSSTAASSGHFSTASSSGDFSTAASSGYYSNASSSGDYSKAAASGDYSNAAAIGGNNIAAVAGIGGKIMVGENGCFAIPYKDNKNGRARFLNGYVGEDGIKANTWYHVVNGKITQCKE